MTEPRPLKVFLCHSSGDKPAVRELYQKLAAEGWVDPWLDEEKLFPGQDWDVEIEKAVEAADVVIVCLSQSSINKEGYVQRELRFVLDIALTKPEETIFLIPLRLENCAPPRRLRAYQYADYFPKEQRGRGYERLLYSLKMRAQSLGIQPETKQLRLGPEKPVEKPKTERKPVPQKQEETLKREPARAIEKTKAEPKIEIPKPANVQRNDRYTWGGIEFMRIPAGKFLMGSANKNGFVYDSEYPQHIVDLTYDYWMARFPIVNEQYAEYAQSKGISYPVNNWQNMKNYPVVSVSWFHAQDFCRWLNERIQGQLQKGLIVRLPTEAEWEKAARGDKGWEWPWGNKFDANKCNSSESKRNDITPVDFYLPRGDSPYGCADMVGNVWEWTNSIFAPYPYQIDARERENTTALRVLRGGAYYLNCATARCASRNKLDPHYSWQKLGFRVCIAPTLIV